MVSSRVLEAVDALFAQQDPAALRPVLHPRVRWDSCLDADAVVLTMESMLRAGADVQSWDTTTADNRIMAAVHGTMDGTPMTIHLVMLVEDDQITHILNAPDDAGARTVEPVPEPAAQPTSAQLNSMAAVLPCRDVPAALAHYERLGFATHSYDNGYGYADREGVSLHLAGVADLDPLTTTSAVYLFVNDAAALHLEWIGSGAGGRFIEPEATDYGLLEGAHLDPDGNLVRYGSRIR